MNVSFQTRGNMSVITKSSEREVIAIFPHNKYLLITTTMINFHIYIYIYRERERERERERRSYKYIHQTFSCITWGTD